MLTELRSSLTLAFGSFYLQPTALQSSIIFYQLGFGFGLGFRVQGKGLDQDAVNGD